MLIWIEKERESHWILLKMAVKLCTWFLSQGMMSGLNSSSNHSNVHFFSPSYRLLPASCKMRHRNLRVDLCHQANDEDDEDEDSSSQEALLDKTSNKSSSSKIETHRKCFPLRFHHVGSCQKTVMLVTVLVFVVMLACAVIIWIGWERILLILQS